MNAPQLLLPKWSHYLIVIVLAVTNRCRISDGFIIPVQPRAQARPLLPSTSTRQQRQPSRSIYRLFTRPDESSLTEVPGSSTYVTNHSEIQAFRDKDTAAAAKDDDDAALTSVLFQVSYDGSRFSGWSAGNAVSSGGTNNKKAIATHPPRSSRRRRNRHLYSADSSNNSGIRSVEGVLKLALAKVYGNVAPDRIVVEGTSRTDKGVHALGMVAHVYCLSKDGAAAANAAQTKNDNNINDTQTNATSFHNNSSLVNNHDNVIPGKALPHPRNGTDATCFLPIPMTRSKLAFTLNRMLPPDVRILRVAALPTVWKTTNTSTTTTESSNSATPNVFHASQSATAKTYAYYLSTGPRPDPMHQRSTWHVGHLMSVCDNNTNVTALLEPVTVFLTKEAYNFQAFAGAPRGSQDRRSHRQRRVNPGNATKCRLHSIEIIPVVSDGNTIWRGNEEYRVYKVTITGDRFLYKMVRFLAGTLVGVAQGHLSLQDVEDMLTSGDRQGVSLECAPAHGLVLEQVHYDNCIDLNWEVANS